MDRRYFSARDRQMVTGFSPGLYLVSSDHGCCSEIHLPTDENTHLNQTISLGWTLNTEMIPLKESTNFHIYVIKRYAAMCRSQNHATICVRVICLTGVLPCALKYMYLKYTKAASIQVRGNWSIFPGTNRTPAYCRLSRYGSSLRSHDKECFRASQPK